MPYTVHQGKDKHFGSLLQVDVHFVKVKQDPGDFNQHVIHTTVTRTHSPDELRSF